MIKKILPIIIFVTSIPIILGLLYIVIEKYNTCMDFIKGKIRKTVKPYLDKYNKVKNNIKEITKWIKENKTVLYWVLFLSIFNFVFSIIIQNSLQNTFEGINIEWWGVITEIIILYLLLGSIDRKNRKKERISDTETKLWEELKINPKNNDKIFFLIRRLNKENASPQLIKGLKFNTDKYNLKTKYEINNLSNMKISKCEFNDIIFSEIDFQNSIFTDCEFYNCEFRGSDLSYSQFIDCHIESKENSKPFINTNFKNCIFKGCGIWYFDIIDSKNINSIRFCGSGNEIGDLKLPNTDLSEFVENNNDNVKIILDEEKINVITEIDFSYMSFIYIYKNLKNEFFHMNNNGVSTPIKVEYKKEQDER